MGKSAPKAPAPPDPVKTAQAQSAANRETAIAQAGLNSVNQRTPFGNLTYNQIGTWQDGTPRFEAVQTLSPAEQRQLDLSNRASELYGTAAVNQLGAVQQQLSQPFNPTLPALRDKADFSQFGDPNVSREGVEQALFARLNPQLQQQRAGLETQLRNQGLMPGTEAWRNAIDDANRGENDARLAVIAQGGAEQSRLAGLGFQASALGNNARTQSLQEQLTLRSQPINEASALLTGQMIQQPNLASTPQTSVAPTDVIGAQQMAYQGQLNNFNQQMGARNATMGGLFGLGGAALGGWLGGRR